MQISTNVRFRDVIAFYIDSLTREISALGVLGTISTLIAAILVQAYIRGGTEGLTIAAIGTGAVAASCATLFYGGIALMAVANKDANQPTGEIAYEISKIGVALRTSERLHQYSWDRITNIGHSDKFVWIHIEDKHYRFIPRRSLSSDDQLAAVWSALEKSRHDD
jgi:hypothetical protein